MAEAERTGDAQLRLLQPEVEFAAFEMGPL